MNFFQADPCSGIEVSNRSKDLKEMIIAIVYKVEEWKWVEQN